jgi:Reverse transcriptase (RNA-dependent DNA polymerase)
MTITIDYFITQMKLREARLQRERANKAYDQLEADLFIAPDDGARVRLLYDRLRSFTFASKPLHPDIANLDIVLAEIDAGVAQSETVAFWLRSLKDELAAGRRRAEIIYLAGALLEENFATDATQADINEQSVALQSTLARMQERVATADDQTFIDAFVLNWKEEPSYYESLIAKTIYARVELDELDEILQAIHHDAYRSSSIRMQAQEFLLNATLKRELADALTIQIIHLDEWQWPEHGVPVSARWQRTRWRMYIDEDLSTTCLLEIIGQRWQSYFTTLFHDHQVDHAIRLQRLIELDAPTIIVDNERRLMERGVAPSLTENYLLWSEFANFDSAPIGSSRIGDSNSILAKRAQTLSSIRDIRNVSAYYMDQPGVLDDALQLVTAEVQLASAAFPEHPFFVLKADLQNCYVSWSHESIIRLLRHFQLPARDLDFFRRYLAIPLRHGNEIVYSQSGLPMNRILSDLLAELLLRILDHAIQQHTRAMIIRVIDDMFVLATSPDDASQAWKSIQQYCAAFGVHLNQGKCGARAFHATLPAELPQSAPCWLMLSLAEDGHWQVDEDAYAAFQKLIERRIQASPAILEQVRIYNAAAAYLQVSLGVRHNLDEQHRRHVHNILLRFHYHFMNGGIVSWLRHQLQQRFAVADSVPEAWFYWPITAGGLGLRHPVVPLATTSLHPIVAPPKERPANWLWGKGDWSSFYHAHFVQLLSKKIVPLQVMETRVNDFINRGQELSSGKQQSLSTYWHWILYTYGAPMLSLFGSFRFLFTELVPLRLIAGRGDVSSMDEDEG